MAHLSSKFGAQYGKAKLWAGVYQFKRTGKPGCRGQGKDVTRALAANQQEMLAAGIPAALSEVGDLYYLHELSLTAASWPPFWPNSAAEQTSQMPTGRKPWRLT